MYYDLSISIIQPGKENITNTFEDFCVTYHYNILLCPYHLNAFIYVFTVCIHIIKQYAILYEEISYKNGIIVYILLSLPLSPQYYVYFVQY